jgi:RNA polymerase sigma factor (sigma-70 family)
MLGGGEVRGDRAFERLYRRHVSDVYRYACAVLANPADAEDVSQTVFLNAYRAFQNGTRPDEPLNWLIAITHNVCRQRFRDGSRRPREVVLDPDLAAERADDEQRFRREDILRALSQLSLNQRSALAMRELEGRSYGEIASVLGTSKAAVETLLFRARRSFREQLEGSLTCSQAERAISLQLDGMLPREERSGLRAHLRACPECASLARSFRAQSSALKHIGLLPLPASLAGGFGLGGGAAVGTAIGVKAVAVGAAALVVAGVGTKVATHSRGKSAPVGKAPLRARAAAPAPVVAEQVPTAASLAAARSIVAEPAATRSTRRTRPEAAHAPRPARTQATPVAALAPPVREPSATAATADPISAPTSTAPAKSAARQQPQLSGGGHSQGKPHALTVPGPARPAPAADRGPAPAKPKPTHPAHPVHPAHPGHPAHPAHPDHPDHPAHPDNPAGADPPGGSDHASGGPPAPPAPALPEPPVTTEVPAPTTPEVPEVPAPHGHGGPPVAPPAVGKPPASPGGGKGKPKGVALPF